MTQSVKHAGGPDQVGAIGPYFFHGFGRTGCLSVAVSPDELEVCEPVTLGLRPEHVALAPPGTSGLPVLVRHVEALGEHSIVHLAHAGEKLLLAKSANEELRIGMALALSAPPSRAHVFRANGTAQPALNGGQR